MNGRASACAFYEAAERISGCRLSSFGSEDFWFVVHMVRDRTRANHDHWEGFAVCHFRNPGSLVHASFVGVYDLD
jgi:hypothetical protein